MSKDTKYVPLLSKELADYLKDQFSADRQIREGLVGNRSESFMLGYLAGLGHAQQVLNRMLDEQAASFEDPNDGDPTAGYFYF